MPPAQTRRQHGTIVNAIRKHNYQKISQHKIGSARNTRGNCHPQQAQLQQQHKARTNLQTKSVSVNTGIKRNIFSNTTGKVSRPAKRLRLEGANPLNLIIVTHFQVFFRGPRAPKRESKWKPKWSLGALKITTQTKNEENKH